MECVSPANACQCRPRRTSECVGKHDDPYTGFRVIANEGSIAKKCRHYAHDLIVLGLGDKPTQTDFAQSGSAGRRRTDNIAAIAGARGELTYPRLAPRKVSKSLTVERRAAPSEHLKFQLGTVDN